MSGLVFPQKFNSGSACKNASENVVCLSRLLHIFAKSVDLCNRIEANSVYPDQNAFIEQSYLDLHCLTKRLQKHLIRVNRWQKLSTFVVIDI